MSFDLEREFGVNAGYVQALLEEWRQDAQRVDASWREIFERATGERGGAPAALPEEARGPGAESVSEEAEYEALSGVAGRIVTNMEASLELPTATSVRTLSAKVLAENRAILNEHMQVRALGKASYTHLIAFALAKAIGEMPRIASAFVERDGKAFRRIPAHVNLGLAIDVPGPRGRMLVVPSIKAAQTMDFARFHRAFEDLVRRGREGKLTPEDYAGTNVTLTNPGGFGTEMSVPRLMKGQGLIVATGSIAIPQQLAGASPLKLAEIAVGPVMTMTSTYDHRVIQGAESGLFLKRCEELLQGRDDFYGEIFEAMRVPWRPHVLEQDRDGLSELGPGEKQTKVWELINAYRVRGCRLADLDPLEYHPDLLPSLDPGSYGFTVWDLDRRFLAGGMHGQSEMTLREILAVLRKSYCRRWSIEYMHVVDRPRKHWLRAQVEDPAQFQEFSKEERLSILRRLHRAENFERYLHTQYVGNKRFSLEGADSLIPALAEIIERAAESGVEEVLIGMAHRGRLNVLANILGKSYEQIFREFEGVMLPLSTEGSGDVKYHLGQRGSFRTRSGKQIEVVLSPNPSHLEAVDPVVCGMTRALQDARGDGERRRVLAVLVHGDAAFSGQGVVAETLNMSDLRAYTNGGTVHLVVNNQIGFTAGPRDLRSTYYCTDIAKSIQAPILHANGDYPESVLRAVRVAVDYQRQFGGDAVVDMVCYRRWGHNEGDEPAYTQPVLYAKIRQHPTVLATYTRLLERRGDLSAEELRGIIERFEGELKEAKRAAQTAQASEPEVPVVEAIDLADDDPRDYSQGHSPATGVPHERLVEIIDGANRMPEGLVVHPNLLRQLRRREKMVRGEQGLDWGCAETLAFGTLLGEGVAVRLTGQDSGRGTFSHRHAVIRDQTTGREHVPLAQFAREGAQFWIYDSLLSEEAVLAFEYGYSLQRPQALVLWEAQFGDFANGAQIAIDQFIVSGEAKWKEKSGVTLLLPHGYDGQGPEHSSARVERFLSLAAEGNIRVANCTTSAQMFHLLRRQASVPDKHPLIVFTPKSLLRDKRAASPVEAFTRGGFREVIDDEQVAGDAQRLILCSGQIYYGLRAYREQYPEHGGTAIVRLEQLYPFPKRELEALFGRHPSARVVWCQEEPRNMGAWTFLSQRARDFGWELHYSGRPMAASPATGSYRRHGLEEQRLIQRAFEE